MYLQWLKKVDRKNRQSCNSPHKYFDVVIHLSFFSKLWDKIVLQLSNIATLWDKVIFHLSKFSTLRGEIVIHLPSVISVFWKTLNFKMVKFFKWQQNCLSSHRNFDTVRQNWNSCLKEISRTLEYFKFWNGESLQVCS